MTPDLSSAKPEQNSESVVRCSDAIRRTMAAGFKKVSSAQVVPDFTFLLLTNSADLGGGIAQWIAFTLPNPAALTFPIIYCLVIEVAEVYQWRCRSWLLRAVSDADARLL